MSSALDMSLDDIIKSSKRPTPGSGGFRGRGGRGGGGGGGGPSRRFPNRISNRPSPYAMVAGKDTAWQNGMFGSQMAAAAAAALTMSRSSYSIETGTKLYISNLEYGVSNEDIKELFSEVGDLKRFGIHYDKSGRSKGTAEVVFSRQEDALAAMKRYNNVQLDGKPMHIEVIGTNIIAPAPMPHVLNAGFLNSNVIPKSTVSGRGGPGPAWSRGGFVGRGRGRGRGGRGFGGRGAFGRGRGEFVTAESLDAELDKYHLEAMQIN